MDLSLPVCENCPVEEQITAIKPIEETVAEVPAELTRPLLITMAVACGLAIANVAYNQPLLAQIGRSLHVSVRSVGILPTVTQIGFASGVFFLAPLGDVLERRRLILIMLGLVTVSLLATALAPNLPFLAIASMAVGVTSVISTLVLPFAVALSRPDQRGATVGSIASAMLIGTLLSRTLSGAVGQLFGWRIVYALAAVMMVLLAIAMRTLLPRSRPSASLSYSALLRSMLGFLRTEPILREATINGMFSYGALSAFWASLIFLVEGPSYHYGAAAAGLFGLVGAGSALLAPIIGRLTDSYSPRILVGIAACMMLTGFLIVWLFGFHLWGLILGVVVLDIAAQSATVSNQASVYRLADQAHSRLYTVYRAAYSLGGSMGAYLGVLGWSLAGWNGVCIVGVGLIIIALLLHHRFQRQSQTEQETATC